LCSTQAGWRREAAMAKLVAGRAVRLVTHAATLTHGGYGFMEEFGIQLYFRRAKQFEHLLEGPFLQRELIADEDSEDLLRVN
jgi:alkylation response protein AidB-like acyl-CoA dehydrogenase